MKQGWIVVFCVWAAIQFGCTQSSPGERVAEEKTFEVRGQVVDVVFDGKALKIAHEEIPGFMGAMTMDLKLEDPDSAKTIRPGDKIAFILVSKADEMLVRGVRRLPPEAELVLEGQGTAHPSHPPAQ